MPESKVSVMGKTGPYRSTRRTRQPVVWRRNRSSDNFFHGVVTEGHGIHPMGGSPRGERPSDEWIHPKKDWTKEKDDVHPIRKSLTERAQTQRGKKTRGGVEGPACEQIRG